MKVTNTTVSIATAMLISTSHAALAAPASEACTLSGSTYTCDGTGNGAENETGDGFTVNVGVTGDINSSDTDEGIHLNDNNTISNNGTIQNVDDGIEVNDNNTITNNGLIDVENKGIIANDNNVIVNAAGATVRTDDGDAIDVNDGNTITNDGTIDSSDDDAIVVEDRNTVINNGDIFADYEGIEGEDNNTLINNGTITSNQHGMEGEDGNEIINNGSIVSDDEDGINVDDNNIVTNNGDIDADSDGISTEDDGDGNTIVNNGAIIAGDDGIEIDDDSENNTVTNNGTITADDDGINVDGDFNIITNNGTITSDDEGIEGNDLSTFSNIGTIIAGEIGISVDDNNTVTNTGSITAGEHGIELEDENTFTNDGMITSTGGNGVNAGSFNTILNNGTIVSETRNGIVVTGDGNTITNNGTITGVRGIFSKEERRPGPPRPRGPEAESLELSALRKINGTTVINNGTITGIDEGAIVFSGSSADSITNNGVLIGGDGTAVRMGEGSDTFIWQSNSQVTGSVEMGSGRDYLNVESADVIGVTRFNSLEDFEIAEGSAAIIEHVRGDDYDLYTGSPTMLASTGQMVGGLTHDLTRRMLNARQLPSIEVSQDAKTKAKKWWVAGNASFQRDNGQGFTQQSQNVTVGTVLGGFNVFFGLENATADLSDNTQSVDQQMVYLGASKAFEIGPKTDFVGLVILGATDSDYNTTGGSTSGNGTFGSVSGRVNYTTDSQFVLGAYAGYASHTTDAIATASGIGFTAQSSDSVFGGVDLRMPSIDYANGALLSPVISFGRVNGSADSVTMSAGGSTTTVAGTNTKQEFASIGLELDKNTWQGSAHVRFDTGKYLTLDLGFKTSF